MPPTESRLAALELGKSAEDQARNFLTESGLTLLDAGWHCRLGEIDLIMQHDDTLVFVEVRARAGGIGCAVESVDKHKQKRLVRAARVWLGLHPVESTLPARFDLVAISGTECLWLKDVISVSG